MSRHATYTYYTTGDKLLKRIDFYNDAVTAYKSIEYAYNDRNQVTTITIKYDATITDTITYTYNTDGTISDVAITHSVVEPEAELQNGGEGGSGGGTTEPSSGEENEAGGGTSEPQNEDNSEEVEPIE